MHTGDVLASKPLKGTCFSSQLQMTVETTMIIETLVALGAEIE